MRRHEFTTLIDPFEARFGRHWAAVLFVPAMLAEVFWSAELLVAIGSTFGAILDMDLRTAILVSAVVVDGVHGARAACGRWRTPTPSSCCSSSSGSPSRWLIAAPNVGGLAAIWSGYAAAAARTRRRCGRPWPPRRPSGRLPGVVSWWDVSLMLMLGGIPWNCYFQRVLACRTPARAQAHSLFAGALTIALTLPPLLLGQAALLHAWPADLAAQLQQQPSQALPLLLRHAMPPVVALLGLGAIVGAVTSSFSASILSAGAMFAWNGCHRLWWRRRVDAAAEGADPLGHRRCSARGAAVLALKVQSVQALWFFTSDLVFVLLFPQFVWALYDRKANLAGSMAAFSVSLALRLGGGEPLLGMPAHDPVSGVVRGVAAGRARRLVRRRGDAVPVQDARGAPGWCCCRWCRGSRRAGRRPCHCEMQRRRRRDPRRDRLPVTRRDGRSAARGYRP